MAEKTPRIIKVSAANINANALGDAGRTTHTATRKVALSSDNQWAITVLMINQVKPLADFDPEADVKDIAESVRDTFKTHFVATYEDLPAQGKNARTGKMMEITDKAGDIKWSSWEETRNPISYCGDIAQVIKAGLTDELILSETSVLAKGEILAQAKSKEAPADTIKRCLDMCDKKYPELNMTDLHTSIELVKALHDKMVKHLEDCAKAVSA